MRPGTVPGTDPRAAIFGPFLPLLIGLVRLLNRVLVRPCGAPALIGDGRCELRRGHEGAHGYEGTDGSWTGWVNF